MGNKISKIKLQLKITLTTPLKYKITQRSKRCGFNLKISITSS